MADVSDYTDEKADEICELVAEGENLNIISKKDGFPARSTIYKWLNDNERFSNNYTRAIKHRADARFDKINQVIDDMRNSVIDSQMARVEIDAYKWQAGKENSQKYGDRTIHANDKENPITSVMGLIDGKSSGIPETD